jgi:hypothetical protein
LPPALEQLGEVQPVALAAGELPHPLLLVRAPEVEPSRIDPARDLVAAHLDHVQAAGDLLPHGLLRVQSLPGLVQVAKLDRVAEAQHAPVGPLLAHQDAKERGLARPARADHPHDTARRKAEAQVFEQERSP